MVEQCNICLYPTCRADRSNIFFIHSLEKKFGADFVPGLVLVREDIAENQTDKDSCPHRGCVLAEEDRQPPNKENVSYVKCYKKSEGRRAIV